MSSLPPKSASLQDLYWRSEILRVVYWLRGEGYGDLVDVGLIEQFLGVDAATGMTFLDCLVDEGLLVRDGNWYALSARGWRKGEEEFATAFSDMLRPTHGECSPECWCQFSTDETDACSRQRGDDRGASR